MGVLSEAYIPPTMWTGHELTSGGAMIGRTRAWREQHAQENLSDTTSDVTGG